MEQEYQEYINQPYFKVHKAPTYEEWLKIRNKNNGEIKKAPNKIVSDINKYFGELQYNLENNKVLKGKHTIPFTFLTAMGLPHMVQNFLGFANSTIAGYAGNKSVDMFSKISTGKSYNDLVSDKTGLVNSAVEITNPGNFVDPSFATKAISSGIKRNITVPLYRRAQKAVYRNITPFGYNETGAGIGKPKEFINALKDFLWFGVQLPTGKGQVPWINKFFDGPAPENIVYPSAGLNTPESMIALRDQAWRKAMKIKPTDDPQIYIRNSDGTYSYDIDAINKIRIREGAQPLPGNLQESDLLVQIDPHLEYSDVFTGNGGMVGVTFDNGNTFMEDVWDIQPFKERIRSLFPGLEKTRLKDWEAVSALKGKTFKVKHKLENE